MIVVTASLVASSCGCPHTDEADRFELVPGTYSIEEAMNGNLAEAQVTLTSDTLTIQYESNGSTVVVQYAIDVELY